MSDVGQIGRNTGLLLGSFLAVGFIAGGWVLGAEIKATRFSEQFVTVRGLAERDVRSDLAIWPLGFEEVGDDLSLLYAKTEQDKNGILQFLAQQGVQPSEVELGAVRVVDTQANQYGGAARPLHRYIIEQQISVRTPRVDTVAAAVQKTVLLLQKGIVLSGNPNEGVVYRFTGLNSVKPDMITEATRNARAAADRFASDSGSKVGAIRQANQGIFSIVAADHSSDASEPGGFGGAFSADSSIMKTVRVVTTMEYYLEK